MTVAKKLRKLGTDVATVRLHGHRHEEIAYNQFYWAPGSFFDMTRVLPRGLKSYFIPVPSYRCLRSERSSYIQAFL